MVNGGVIRQHDMRESLPVHRLWIEYPVRLGKRQTAAALGGVDLAVETGTAAGVTGRADLLDADPDRVLIAIDAHLDDPLNVAGAFTFSPQRFAETAVIPGLPARNRLAE